MGFGQGLSGLNASSQDLDVIGNNIANSKTVGFKSGTATFADVYANSRVGLGVQVASINQRFTTGTIASTGNEFDIAIDGAKGLFVVNQPSGETLYTRNGQFFADKDSFIVNAQGQRLQGYAATGTDGQGRPILATNLSDMVVPYGNIDPNATSTITNKINLNANAEIPANVGSFNPTDPSSFNNMSPITIYDSLGNSFQVQQYYSKTGENTWDVNYVIDGATVGTHQIDFKTNGSIDSGATGSFAFSPPGAEPMTVAVNYAGSSQFAGEFTQNFTQNGYPTGEYASISIGTDGMMQANYTNGAKKIVGSIALADFNNLQGLQPVGGNAWAETASSGQAILGTPGNNGLATLKGQAVEESNVDMSQELVNMIIAQRTYQANAQTIKTQDQLMQTLITLR